MRRIILAAAITASTVAAVAPAASATPLATSATPVPATHVKAESVWCDGWGFCVGAWWRVPSAIMGRWWLG